ncbi:hypothetical protein [Anaerobiospirillum succiniciproducens]|uniref:hypothetical protein n=1 Tax=Anaerobiospirillum succiniciproducens TaxID=13335 RepID=UPI002942C4FF|nr:hypothetical protein [Anaerobiospirillum succiniciproducens]
MGKEPSLTHVSMWLNHSWKAIGASEAYELMGKTGVPIDQRMFICNLCGQFVTLVAGDKQVPHFRHSKGEADKECKERTFASKPREYSANAHSLPIRIVKEQYSNKYRFDLGLIRIPFTEFHPDFGIKILPCDTAYSYEHLNLSSITYVSLGYRPYESYQIKLKDQPRGLRAFWPERVAGINPKGTVFNKRTGIRLNYDADVLIDESYLILVNSPLSLELGLSLELERIEHEQASLEGLYLYEVKATDYDDNAAKFFIQFNCRLTERPAKIQPIWPLYANASYCVKHNSQDMYLLVSGNVTAFKTYPNSYIEHLGKSHDDKDLYRISCEQRQQLVSTGRSDVLQYTYLWKEPLDIKEHNPQVKVTDLKEKAVFTGLSFDLPINGCLRFYSSYDGYIVQRNRGEIIERTLLKAEQYVSIHNISYGTCVEVCIGHDIVWSHEYKRKELQDSTSAYLDAPTIMRRLNQCSAPYIKAPHTLRNIQRSLHAYPQLAKWISTCIAKNTISVRAYRLLEHIYRNDLAAMETTHE